MWKRILNELHSVCKSALKSLTIKNMKSKNEASAQVQKSKAPPKLENRGSKTSRIKGKLRITLVPADWIAMAEQVLVDKSIDGVRVDVLATKLKVTRGSFYYHFINREDLLRRVLHSWKEKQTEDVIARTEKKAEKPETVIQELTELPFHGESARVGGSVELAIRAWARRDELARLVVDEVDKKRLDYLQHCFKSLGFTAAGARVRAFTLYSYMQSESIFRALGTQEEKLARRKFVAGVVLSKAAPC
jgi:AcrR family transcriptional regulator